MKLYISADIEGVTGVGHWDETMGRKPEFAEFREQMTAEVAAACEGGARAGATEIWVKDAHGAGRNVLAAKLPRVARLIRGRSGHPFNMMQEIDETFDAVAMIGYHSRAGAGGNPLAHTIKGRLGRIRINGSAASEFLLNAYTAALVGAPVVFVSGDKGLCDEVAELNPSIGTTAVKEGVGDSTVSIHPGLAADRIRDGVAKALGEDIAQCAVTPPDHFEVEIAYKYHYEAYKGAFFPGASLEDAHTIRFETDSYFEVLRLLLFVV